MSSFSVGLHGSLQRVQHPLLGGGLLLAVMLTILVALIERRLGPGAADRTLTGITFGLALPLAALGVVTRTCRTLRLDQAFSELARHGADRRWLALGQTVAGAAIGAAIGTLLGVVSVLAARRMHDPALLRDIWATAAIGALAGAVYACWFVAASSWGKRGTGRIVFLVLDWTLGSSSSALAVVFPRGHVLNLLGASPPLGLAAGASTALLVGLTFLVLALAISRIPR
ncbi:MAG TPA: hypothetical protein VI197_16135 [Polyangiaceae bacterium]